MYSDLLHGCLNQILNLISENSAISLPSIVNLRFLRSCKYSIEELESLTALQLRNEISRLEIRQYKLDTTENLSAILKKFIDKKGLESTYVKKWTASDDLDLSKITSCICASLTKRKK